MPLITTAGINSASKALGGIASIVSWYADRSRYSRTVTLVGNVEQKSDTSTPAKYAIAYKNQSSDYGALQLPLSAFPLGATKFYIDTVFRVKRSGDIIFRAIGTPLSGSTLYLSGYGYDLLNYSVVTSATDNTKFSLEQIFLWRDVAVDPTGKITGTTEISPNSWNHLAVIFDDGKITTYLNGKLEIFVNPAGGDPIEIVLSGGSMALYQSNGVNAFDPAWNNTANLGVVPRLDVCVSESTTQAQAEAFCYFRAVNTTTEAIPTVFGLIAPRAYTIPPKTNQTQLLLTNGSVRVPVLARWMDDASLSLRNVAFGGDVKLDTDAGCASFGLTANSTSPGALIVDEFIDVRTNTINLDFWLNTSSLDDQSVFCFKNKSNATKLHVHIKQGRLRVDNGSVFASDGVPIAISTWYHVRVTREPVSSVFKIFIDGVLADTGITLLNDNTYNLWIGSNAVIGYGQTSADLPPSTNKFRGSLGNIRIVTDLLDGNTNFTKPAALLPLVNNTELLLDFQATDIPSYSVAYLYAGEPGKANGDQPRLYDWLAGGGTYFYSDSTRTAPLASGLPLKGAIINILGMDDEYSQASTTPPAGMVNPQIEAVSVLVMQISADRMPTRIEGSIGYRKNNKMPGSFEDNWDNYVRIHSSTISCDINLPNANLLIDQVTIN
jgi:hypothetical protein